MSPRSATPTGDPPADPQQEFVDRARARRSMPQLTPRAVLTGALIGAVTGVSNLYVGLKVGWSLGVVITASIVGWALWKAARSIGLLGSQPTILEANAMASTASAAGYSTGTTLVSAIAAWLIVSGHHLPLLPLMAWMLAISMLGLFGALLLRHQLLHVERLPFPTGVAAAETLESLAGNDDAASGRARALLWALGAGLLLKFIVAVLPFVLPWSIPAALPTPSMAASVPILATLVTYGFVLQGSALLPAAGVLVGWRVCWSLLLGAVIAYGVLAPRLVDAHVVASVSYEGMISWSVWPGATLMTVASLMSLPSGRGLWRRLLDLRALGDDGDAEFGIPRRWILAGLAGSGLGCVVLQRAVFDIPVGLAMLSVALALVLALVAARVTGETDITPTGPLAKVSQLAFGPALPGQPLPNLIVAGVSAGAAASAADLLTDLKAGYVLGANPRQQFLAQLLGVLVGIVFVVPVFRYGLVPDASVLGTAQWPAPAAKVWASVSQLVGGGLAALPAGAPRAVLAAAVVAVVLGALERWAPRFRAWIPSATGLGLAFVLPADNAVSFFVGGAAALWIVRRRPAAMLSLAVPIAAGLIAGESLMGVVEALLASAR